MIQCTHCRRWLHSHCESLSALEYQLLSNLPDDTPYVCLLCSAAREPQLQPSGMRFSRARVTPLSLLPLTLVPSSFSSSYINRLDMPTFLYSHSSYSTSQYYTHPMYSYYSG